jgi:glyoxylase-like metal-dependent hydrolase (beta-lactamase superfamily II)
LGCNCTILGDPITKEAVVVDPGGEPGRILEEVRSLGLTVTNILHTHAHFDHFLASGEIKRATGASLCLHTDDRSLWQMLEVQCRTFGIPYTPVPLPDHWLRDEETLMIGNCELSTLHTPGHTPGSICLLVVGANLLFSGDTLFRGGIGRTDLWGGDFKAIERSIRERLFTLKEDIFVVTGHGPETQIGFERECNPFLNG